MKKRKKLKFRKKEYFLKRDKKRDFVDFQIPRIPTISKIKLLANSGLSPAPSMRLARIKQNLEFSPLRNIKKSICEARSDRRRALFRSGKAGKIKVHFAKWTLKSLLRCNK